MGRVIKRVALNFDWPLNKVWEGYLSPDNLGGDVCPGCVRPTSYPGETPRGDGYSRHAQHLHDLWYGYLPFDPETNGSVLFTPNTPAVRARAERNIANDPDYYGRGEGAILAEARRLCDLFNGQWCHHLNYDDIAALIAAGRLVDFTHTWSKGSGWEPIDPPVVPLPAEVNEWSIAGMGHDALNAWVVIEARCQREGQPYGCDVCDGHGTVEAYPGQRADADAWTPTEPPAGEGWQLWETTSEGSPIGPVFATAEELAQWLTTGAGGSAVGFGRTCRPMTIEQARGFVGEGWAPSMFGNAGGLHDGAEYVGTEAALRGHDLDV